jgi:hypothetical protein
MDFWNLPLTSQNFHRLIESFIVFPSFFFTGWCYIYEFATRKMENPEFLYTHIFIPILPNENSNFYTKMHNLLSFKFYNNCLVNKLSLLYAF